MVVQILQNMARSIGGVARETGQFRQAAAQQNKSISNFIKDISKIFNSQNKQQSGIASSLDDIQYQSVQTSSKIDSTNALLQESISLQSQMLSELRNLSSGISALLGGVDGAGGLFGRGGAGFGTKSLAAAGGLGLAAGALGSQGLDFMSGMGMGGGNSGGSAGPAGTADTGGSATGEKLSVASMVKLAEEAGFTKEQAVIMGAIGAAESSGRTSAHNPNASTGDNSYGIWQINMLGRMGPERRKLFGIESNEELFDPKKNAIAAKKIFDQQGFGAWSVYKGGQYRKYLGTAQESVQEKDDGNNQDQIQGQKRKSGTGEVVSKESAIAGGSVTYAYGKGTTRNKPIQPRLMSILQLAAREAGVDVQVFSGGQPAKGSGGKRTGSTRHDNGNAADVRLLKGGKKVTDQETIAKFIAAASKAGATGIGHGPGYMEQGGIHVGFGKPAVWGAGGRGANAPSWVRAAAKGVYSNENLASSKDTGTRSAAAAEYGGGGMAGLASMGGAGGMPDLGAMGLGGLGSAISFLSGIGGNMIGALTGMASGDIFGAINSQISSLTSPERPQDSPEKTPKKEAGQNPTETFSSYKPASLVQNQNTRTEQLAETSTRASMPAIPQADDTQKTYAADPTGGDPKISLGKPGQQMALNGAQDNMVLADWYTNLFGKGGGNIVPDRDFYKNLA